MWISTWWNLRGGDEERKKKKKKTGRLGAQDQRLGAACSADGFAFRWVGAQAARSRRPGAHWTEIKEKARPFSLISTMFVSLFLLSHSSLPPHDFHQPFTIFSLKSSINPSSSSYSSSISFLEALSLFSFRERNGGGRRPKSSIKFLLSFATQGNSLSSNLHLFHGYGRFFLED